MEGRSAKSVLYTIGYEGLSIAAFIDVLHAHAVSDLVDVRDLPLSRKPGFSKNQLASALKDEGIEYTHLRSLGAPKPIRHALKLGGNWQAYRDAYLELLNTQRPALDLVASLLHGRKVGLVCFERDYRSCHRSLIAERMGELGLVSETRHLHPQKEAVVVAS